MTSPPEPQTWRDAVKALLLAAVGVAAAFYALVLIVTAVFLSGLDIDFDLNLNFTHPHFSPDGLEGEDAVREFMAVQMLAHGPETVFVIQRGESTQAAAARFLKFCLKAWGRRPPSDSSGAVPFFAEWLDRAAAAHAAYAQKYGAADAAPSEPSSQMKR